MPDGESPALGWFLGKASRDLMHKALCRPEHVQTVQAAMSQVLRLEKPQYECQPEPVELRRSKVPVKVGGV
jgi:hypothetical protein